MTHAARVAITVIAASGLASAALAGPAAAKRAATTAESAALWKVVDPAGRCEPTTPTVSTASTGARRFARVTIADEVCGDSQIVLRRTTATAAWRIVTSGSDWGSPESCVATLATIPLNVQRDLFGKKTCAETLPVKSCGALPRPADAPFKVLARGMSCRDGRALVQHFVRTGDAPKTWSCVVSSAEIFCSEGTPKQVRATRDTPALRSRAPQAVAKG